MRTIRIKLYKFNELTHEAKRTAILHFTRYTVQGGKMFGSSLIEIAEYLNKNEYEFTKDGKLN